MTSTARIKLGYGLPELTTPVRLAKVYEVHGNGDGSFLRIGTDSGHVELMLELARAWNTPCAVAYVLVVSRRSANQPGRYFSQYPLSIDRVEQFARRFSTFFEGDGRHHLWITGSQRDLLVYDRHQWIVAYGDSSRYVPLLKRLGFGPGSLQLPVLHAHGYSPDYDSEEDAVVRYWDWTHAPLESIDED